MKSRTEHPPYSFQFLQPETGQTAPFTGSFNHVVEQVITLRRANPFLAERHGWRTDIAGVEAEVDAYNTARCIAGGWLNFVVMDDTSAPDPTYAIPPPSQKKTAVAAVRNVAAGVGVLLEWLGSGAKPVDQSLAENRASICATCPKNGKGGLLSYFTKPAADLIRTQMEMRGNLQLRTSHDEQLGVCEACLCPLKLKAHVPIEHILAHTSEVTKTQLDPRCWILSGT
jgi:hypothetical protein